MTKDELKLFRGVVKEEIETAVKPVTRKLDILWEQVEEVTKGLDEVREKQNSHTGYFKRMHANLEQITDNTHKLNKRVTTLEGKSGISTPPELTIV